MNFTVAELFDLTQTEHAAIFDGCKFAWEALSKIEPYVRARTAGPPNLHCRPQTANGAWVNQFVIIGEGTTIEPGAMIKGPAIIGKNCQIRHGAYIRENVIIGDDCVVGNSSELKNALLFNGAQVPHFNYVGDSILGAKAHLGAGVICSNLKSLPGNVTVSSPKSLVSNQDAAGLETRDQRLETLDTGLRKFGALVGDGAEVGCNSVLNPGSVLGRGVVIYPGVNWRGFLPANNIAKNRAGVEIVVRQQ